MNRTTTIGVGRSIGTDPKSHRDTRPSFCSALCAFVSLWLSLGQALCLAGICLAKPIPTQVKPRPSQTETVSVAVLSFQDESGAGVSDEFCFRLSQHLMKKLYVTSNQTLTAKGVRVRPKGKWTEERLTTLGKRQGVQFVVHSGLLAVSSDNAGGKMTSKAQVYADILSVDTAVMKRLDAEGTGTQKGADSETATDLSAANFRSREFHNTSVGRALSAAIENLAASVYQEIESGLSGEPRPDQRLKTSSGDKTPDRQSQNPADVSMDTGQDDPGATEEAQEAASDEELQQLIAQAQESLNSLSGAQNKEKINALIEALKGLTSALETKAGLLEQGNITGADQVDQQIDAQEQALQAAVDPIIQEGQSPDSGSSNLDPGSGGSKFDQVAKYVDLGFSVLERVMDLRARFRGITQDLGASPQSDPGTGEDLGANPTEEQLETVNGNVSEEEAAPQGRLTVEKQPGALAMLQAQAGENPRGPNIVDSHLNSWPESGDSRTGLATPALGRRRPVIGAEVIEPDSGASARTDSSGSFTLRVPARSAKLVVRKGGAKVAEVAIHIRRGRPTVADIQLGRSGATMQNARVLPSNVVVNRDGRNTGTLNGQVQDGKGQPVPRASVELPGLAMARTDSQGRFAFLRVPAGPQRLTVRGNNSESTAERVRVKPNETTESRIQLNLAGRVTRPGDRLIAPGAGTVLRGSVTDNQNGPVAGAKISAVSTSGSAGAVSIRTRTDGSFELRDLKAGSYQVLVDKVGLAGASQSVSLQAGRVAPLNFRLRIDATSPIKSDVVQKMVQSLGEVRGQVRASTGAPIPNAWVELKGTGKTSPTSPQRTNARGQYLLKALPGRYELRVRAQNFQESSRPVTVQARDSRPEDFNLTPSPGTGLGGDRNSGSGALTGRVTDTNTRAPISDAIVSVAGKSARTDRAGKYSVGNVPAGKQQVSVAKSGYSNEARTVDVISGSPASVNFDLRPTGGRDPEHPHETGQLRGQVTDDRTGRPISGARVTIQGRNGTTDQTGNYTIANLRLGRHQVSVAKSGYSNEARTVDVISGSPASVNFDLRPAGSRDPEHPHETGQLRGRVTDDRTGRPISGAKVTVQGRSATTDQTGNYTIANLRPGRHQVSAAKSGYSNGARTANVISGSPTSVNFDLRPAGSRGSEHGHESGQLRGRVTDDRTSRPISGAIVSIPGQGSDTTDGGGNYTITNLRPGKCQVRITQSRYQSRTDNVDIKAGSPTNGNFELKPASSGNRNSGASLNRNSNVNLNRNSSSNRNRNSSGSGTRNTTVNRNSSSSLNRNSSSSGTHNSNVNRNSGASLNRNSNVNLNRNSGSNRNRNSRSSKSPGQIRN